MKNATAHTVAKSIAEEKANPITLIGRVFREEDGVVFTVQSHNKGWYTSTTADGIEQKNRAADILAQILPEGFDLEAEHEEETADSKKMAKQLNKYRATYQIGVAPSGRKSLNNGDKVAIALEMQDLSDLYLAVDRLFEIDLREKYAHLNKGAQRMNLGNRIRSAFKKEEHKQHEAVVAWVESQAQSDND